MTTPIAQGPRGLPGSAATRKSTTAPKCEKCGCPGVLNTGNADGGKSSEWRCWGWQCRHKWETPNVEGNRPPRTDAGQE